MGTLHFQLLSPYQMSPVLELPADEEIFPHCGCGHPCNTRRPSLGALVLSPTTFFLVQPVLTDMSTHYHLTVSEH